MHAIELKILTYNIHKGFNAGNRQFVLHQIREAIRSTNADLIFLQEIQGEHAERESLIEDWPEMSQFEFLADQIWPHYAYGKNAIYDTGHHGNAILSRYPFIEWENINVSSFPNASRSFLHGVITMGDTGQHAHIICVHFDLIPFERRRQLKLLCTHILSRISELEPLIIAGDFNDWTGRYSARLLHSQGFKEVFQALKGGHAKTFPSRWPILRMDRIYFRGLKPIHCKTYRQKPWDRLSDHIPLYAEFSLEETINGIQSTR